MAIYSTEGKIKMGVGKETKRKRKQSKKNPSDLGSKKHTKSIHLATFNTQC
jgi:hypothetical protein